MRVATVCREEIKVRGTVQGVGFRPFVYRLAQEFGIKGTISNSSQGVVIAAEGERLAIDAFVDKIRHSPPPLAHIRSFERISRSVLLDFQNFSILSSVDGEHSTALIPPDIGLCDDCLRDITDPKNRRYLYPFTNCTNCGPRFSIVETIPYDRSGTSMAAFQLCPDCLAEYEDPADRRFHAQPNGCALCGPEISYHDEQGQRRELVSPMAEVAGALQQGKIVAIRGLGGFHLVVDARSDLAVARLRQRKGRRFKPLAVMASCLEEAQQFCHISIAEATILQGTERPIVLLSQKKSDLAAGLNPDIDEIGVMLPSTPLHQLLFQEEDCPGTLVMTSGNRSGAPLYIANDAALRGLAGIADCFLLHNREILTRVDDSVVRIREPEQKQKKSPNQEQQKHIQMLRRARGYVPAATPLWHEFPPVLACGAGLKSTFCLSRGRDAFLSQHIGDLFNLESLEFFEESIYHSKRLLQVQPVAVVCDLHPDYLSSRYARELNLPLYRVQHHHAHAAAVLVEHGIIEKVLALVLDGSGLGDDNSIWGGELLVVDCQSYKRIGSLATMQLPGGDKAAMEPWRMGLALLRGLGQEIPGLQLVEAHKQSALWQMMAQGFNCPATTSCGRFFDGIAALLGICLVADYEGQAAMELEALARVALGDGDLPGVLAKYDYPGEILEYQGRQVLQQQQLTGRVLERLASGMEPAAIALDFHCCLIQSLADFVVRSSEQTGLTQVVLSGGCMQNSLLLRGLFILLEQRNLTVYTGEQIPVNDGGIALGQAVIGGLAHVSCSSHEGG